jgi:hypothetical protein
MAFSAPKAYLLIRAGKGEASTIVGRSSRDADTRFSDGSLREHRYIIAMNEKTRTYLERIIAFAAGGRLPACYSLKDLALGSRRLF